MVARKNIFLDTSTQIVRHWHSKEASKETNEQLQGHKLYCSHYVKCQYKATLLNSAIKLHNLLLRSQNILEAIQKSTEGRFSQEAGGRLTPGVMVLIADVGYWMSQQCDTSEAQIQRLEDLIEDGWESLFEDGIELPLLDETSCAYTEGAPKQGQSGAFEPIRASCRKDRPPNCDIQHFWETHQDELGSLGSIDSQSIKATPKDNQELQRIKDNAQSVAQGDVPHGTRCTRCLSDAVICIEAKGCPEPFAVHSTNKKHFRPICEVLDIESEPK